MTAIDQLLDIVARMSAATGLSESTISSRYLGGGFVARDLRAGRDMGARRIQRAMLELSRAWPAEAEWPIEIPRPVDQAAE
jgi:hypothetical protein